MLSKDPVLLDSLYSLPRIGVNHIQLEAMQYCRTTSKQIAGPQPLPHFPVNLGAPGHSLWSPAMYTGSLNCSWWREQKVFSWVLQKVSDQRWSLVALWCLVSPRYVFFFAEHALMLCNCCHTAQLGSFPWALGLGAGGCSAVLGPFGGPCSLWAVCWPLLHCTFSPACYRERCLSFRPGDDTWITLAANFIYVS